MERYSARDFHNDCIRAVNQCPQVDLPQDWQLRFFCTLHGSKDRTWRVDPGKVYRHWVNDRVLMNMGYSKHLPKRAKMLFAEIRAAVDNAVLALCDDAPAPDDVIYSSQGIAP